MQGRDENYIQNFVKERDHLEDQATGRMMIKLKLSNKIWGCTMDEDEKGPYILQSEVEKAIKEMRDKKATGDDDIPGDVLKLLGEDGLRLMTQLINSIYVTGEWPRDFIEVTMIALKKPKATKCSDHRTISLIAHSAR
jgi:hypothetical protein